MIRVRHIREAKPSAARAYLQNMRSVTPNWEFTQVYRDRRGVAYQWRWDDTKLRLVLVLEWEGGKRYGVRLHDPTNRDRASFTLKDGDMWTWEVPTLQAAQNKAIELGNRAARKLRGSLGEAKPGDAMALFKKLDAPGALDRALKITRELGWWRFTDELEVYKFLLNNPDDLKTIGKRPSVWITSQIERLEQRGYCPELVAELKKIRVHIEQAIRYLNMQEANPSAARAFLKRISPEPQAVEEFVNGYIEAALWSSIEDTTGQPLDSMPSVSLAPETLKDMRNDCQRFMSLNLEDIGAKYVEAGRDFWLTRNDHGSGFWDGDWPEGPDERLTASAHRFGNYHLEVRDDDMIYAV